MKRKVKAWYILLGFSLPEIASRQILDGCFVPQSALDIIGRVRNSVRQMKRDGWEDVVSEILVKPAYESALDGVEEYSHLLILFWLSRVSPRKRRMLKVHPRSRPDLPLVGIFATRRQYRPNPIALTMVKFIGRKKNVLRVKGLDAMNGTPVITLNPFLPAGNGRKNFAPPLDMSGCSKNRR